MKGHFSKSVYSSNHSTTAQPQGKYLAPEFFKPISAQCCISYKNQSLDLQYKPNMTGFYRKCNIELKRISVTSQYLRKILWRPKNAFIIIFIALQSSEKIWTEVSWEFGDEEGFEKMIDQCTFNSIRCGVMIFSLHSPEASSKNSCRYGWWNWLSNDTIAVNSRLISNG